MAPLFPRLPIRSEETPLSWAARLAAFHTGGRLAPFLHDIEISVGDLIRGATAAIRRLAEMAGEPVDDIARHAITSIGARRASLHGLSFSSEFLTGKTTRFCPSCLAEDGEIRGRTAAARHLRWMWLLRPVRTCPTHGISLLHRTTGAWDDVCRELASLVPESAAELDRLSRAAPRRAPSPLQDYVVNRLMGGQGPAWLDAQDIEQACRATEMLGVLALGEQHQTLSRRSSDEWDEAGRAGWPFVVQGEEGVRAVIEAADDRFAGAANAGVQRILGSFYIWLAFSKSTKDPGPIREVVRQAIFDRFDIAAGRPIFGVALETRRFYSLKSLAAETGTDARTLASFLEAKGIVHRNGRGDLASNRMRVAAAEGIEAAAALKSGVPVVQLPRILGATRPQVAALIEVGLLQRLTGRNSAAGIRKLAVHREEVEELLARIHALECIAVETKPGFLCLNKVTQAARVTNSVVLAAFREGQLQKVGRRAGLFGVASLLFNKQEVAGLAPARVSDELPLHEALRVLRIPAKAAPVIRASQDDPERTILRISRNNGSSGRVDCHVSDAEMIRFRETFATHGNLCHEGQLSHQEVTRRLAQLGVQPILDQATFGTRIYRRSEVPPDWHS